MDFSGICLTALVSNQINRIKRGLLFAFVCFAVGVYRVFIANEREVDTFYLIVMLFFLALLSYLQYTIIKEANASINNTAMEVNVDEEFITIKTIPFKVLFFINKPAKEFRYNINDMTVHRMLYPLKQIYDLDKRVFVLRAKGNECYIITDYFDEKLEGRLDEIVVEKTPERRYR
jgi:hypothetical protein